MRRQIPYIAAAAMAFAVAFLLRNAGLGDVSKVVIVGLTVLVTLYSVEYLLKRRR
ncbi:hypothetical protein [Phaeovulum sp.]|uniref:hypothetical protein n=1 Tax=Phaeovulum sp. TaxID=2934796 RepID=UPI00356683C4